MFCHKIMPTSTVHKVNITNDNILPRTSNITITPHNLTNQTIPNLRPGQCHNRKSTNINIQSVYGDSHLVWDKNDIRIFFQNVKGLTCSHTGEFCKYYMMSTKAIGSDLKGMAITTRHCNLTTPQPTLNFPRVD